MALLRVLERSVAERLGQRFAMALRRALYRHLARMPASELAGQRAGAVGLRFVGDLSGARNWVGLGLTLILTSAVVAPRAVAVLWLLNPVLAARDRAPHHGGVLRGDGAAAPAAAVAAGRGGDRHA